MQDLSTTSRFRWNKILHNESDARIISDMHEGCGTVLIGHQVWMLGVGRNQIGRTYVLDLIQRTWSTAYFPETLFSILSPATLYNDKILILGVFERLNLSGSVREIPGLHFYDPVLEELGVVPTYGGENRPRWKKLHSADLCEEQELLALFGGRPTSKNSHERLYLLDLTTWIWENPRTSGAAPPAPQQHGSCLVGSRLFVFGQGKRSLYSDAVYSIRLSRSTHMHWEKINLPAFRQKKILVPLLCYVGRGRIIMLGGDEDETTRTSAFLIEGIPSPNSVGQYIPWDQSPMYKGLGVTGEAPSRRGGTARLVHTHNKLILVGGDREDRGNYYEFVPE